MSKPRFTHQAREDGRLAYQSWVELQEIIFSDCAKRGQTPWQPPMPECPWPVNTPEGRAWYFGWNEVCDCEAERSINA